MTMLGAAKKSTAHHQAIERVRAWTRTRFNLSEEAALLVVELACTTPGCPPLESVIVFWDEQGTRYRFKLFKAMEQIEHDDLPYTWQMSTLVFRDGDELNCC
mgnify:CR=1 FL=1